MCPKLHGWTLRFPNVDVLHAYVRLGCSKETVHYLDIFEKFSLFSKLSKQSFIFLILSIFRKNVFFSEKYVSSKNFFFGWTKKNEKYLDPSKISSQNDFWWSQDDLSNQSAIFEHLKKKFFFHAIWHYRTIWPSNFVDLLYSVRFIEHLRASESCSW